MTKDSNQNQLLQLRKSIDEIDNQIIDLLNARMKIILQVSDYKKSIKDKFFIKSAREADMIKSLVTKADEHFPKSTIVNIWRKIITSANVLEQNINIALHNPRQIAHYEYLVKEYYGDFVPIIHHDNATDVVIDLEKNLVQIGIFSLNKDYNDHWWINLANDKSGIKVFAKIPFVCYQKDKNWQDTNLFAAAIKDAEKSQDDKTLITIEIENQISKTQIQNTLKELGLECQILKSEKLEQVNNITFYLLELSGFFEESDEKIKALVKTKIKPFVKIIGHYPTPIMV